VGVVLSVVAVIGSVAAFELFAPGLVNPNAIRWGSVIVFGGAGVAAFEGLVLLVMNRNIRPEPAAAGETTPEP
jgi:nitrate reductase gamma subunit